ncbi:MAG: hypothetical protein F7B18_00370 [Desulfurococcales archaeon]|nr:hypothetical protein [Desulfurococcales archaeon]
MKHAAAVGPSSMGPSSPVEAYKRALDTAQGLPRPRLEGEVLVAYTGAAEAPARILYTALTHSGSKALIAHAVEAARHIVPYRDIDTVLIYSPSGRDPRTLSLAETASLVGGGRVALVTPQMHPAYREKAESLGVDLVELTSRAPPILAMALASLYWAPKQMGPRAGRLEAEVGELASALEWAIETLGANPGHAGLEALYTPAAKPGAIYHCAATGCMPRPLEAVLSMHRGAEAVAYMTSVDEQDYRDVTASHTARGIKLHVIRINTDPITAGLYSILAALLITQKPL